jgi:mitogen-activated protein kinase kinase
LQAIVDGDPPDLPADRFSEAAIDFVRGCLNKIPRLRPNYAMLLRHAWLSPLLKPPTISEDDEEEGGAQAVASNSLSSAFTTNGVAPDTADKEVADWVKAALEKKAAGKLASHKKPALHEAPLDAVPGSPLLTQDDAATGSLASAESAAAKEIKASVGVKVDSPDLLAAKVEGMDFASS